MGHPVAIAFHLLPLLPLWMGRPWLVAAAVLFIGLPYIKVGKLRSQLREMQNPESVEALSTSRAIARWHALTLPILRKRFLRDDDRSL